MLHHVEDRQQALAEAQRILRTQGRLALMGYTGEDAATLWILDYFPTCRPWMAATRPPRQAFFDEFPAEHLTTFESTDLGT